jgi:hypothetical protein
MASTAPTADSVVGIGIDISARWFDAARGPELHRFPNAATGISAGLRWLAPAGGAVRVGLEFRFTQNGSRATGHRPGWFLPATGATA